jgi:hypothetical protein
MIRHHTLPIKKARDVRVNIFGKKPNLSKDVVLTQQAVSIIRLATDYQTFVSLKMVDDNSEYYKSLEATYEILMKEMDSKELKKILQTRLPSPSHDIFLRDDEKKSS